MCRNCDICERGTQIRFVIVCSVYATMNKKRFLNSHGYCTIYYESCTVISQLFSALIQFLYNTIKITRYCTIMYNKLPETKNQKPEKVSSGSGRNLFGELHDQLLTVYALTKINLNVNKFRTELIYQLIIVAVVVLVTGC